MRQVGFQHQALVYEGSGDFLAGVVPFVEAALEAEEPVLIAVRATQRGWLEERFGAADGVRYAAIEEVGRNPALIIPLWRDFVEENAGRPVSGVGEPAWPGRSPAALEECRRHAALLNLGFADAPDFSLLCPYDAAGLPSRVLEGIAVFHRRLDWGERARESAEFGAALDCFAGSLPPPAVAPTTLEFGLTELAEVRHRVTAAGEQAGLNPRGVADLVTATSELAANSVMHGGGSGTLRLWREGGRILAEVEDRGRIEDPLVGRIRPDITQEGGRGLWLANQLCELVQIRSGAGGTAVRLHMPVGAETPAAGSGRRQMGPRAAFSSA
ncbi:MAG TPA: sensor histidine kinase [Solirubrobacterales bacterium]|nr:sensor histidine kinase [Solirubrobacterales bacterium]